MRHVASGFGVLRLVTLDERVPFRLQLRAAPDRLAEVRERFIGHVKGFVLRPTELTFGFAHGLLARRVGVRLARALRRHPVADDGLDGDERRAVCLRLRLADRALNRGEVVAVFDR